MEISYPALLLIALVSAFGLGIVAHIAWIERSARSANEPSSSKGEDGRGIFGRSEKGSVFTVLMVGLGMAATLSVVTYQILSGPVASVARVTQHNLAKNQMITINRIALMDAVLQASNGDCDADGYIEPRAWRTTTGAKPTNGGLLPLAMGAPTSDPWMSDYGYCVWDVGTLSAQAGCGGATGRLDGADNPVSGSAKALTVMAVISAGPDRVFQTTCNAYVDANTDLIATTAGSDDLVQRYTYAEAAASGGGEGLWFLKSGDPNTAQISRNIEVGGGGLVQATAVTTTGKIIAGDGLRVGTDTDVTDGECIDTNKGLMRYKAATNVVQFCAGTTLGWVDAGASGGGGGSIDGLSDAIANLANLNLFLGENSGDSITTAKNNIGVGQNTLTALTSGESNVAIGTHNWGNALDSLTTGNSNVAIGPYALDNLTTANGNIAIGEGAGSGLTTGAPNVAIGGGSMVYMGGGAGYNVAVGSQAMQGNGGDAGFSVAIGANALRRVTTGSNNVFMGYEAGDDITTGGSNVGIGFWALSTATTVGNNTALGAYSLANNTAGTPNTGLGSYTLFANTSGRGNVAVGGGGSSAVPDGAALRANTTGNYNIAVGLEALTSNTTGNENIAVGWGSMYGNQTGSNNIAIGEYALGDPVNPNGVIAIGNNAICCGSGGTYNIAIGEGAMIDLSTGMRNIAIGQETIFGGNPSDTIAIGYQALESASSTGPFNVGIGTRALEVTGAGGRNVGLGAHTLRANTTGARNIAIGGGDDAATADGAAMRLNTTGGDNVAVGVAALRSNTTGINNTAVGSTAGSIITTGNSNTAVGFNAGPSAGNGGVTNTTAIGNGAVVSANNTIRIGNSSVTAITGQVDFTFPSDRRDKHDIENSDLGLNFVNSLRPVSYRLNGGSGRLDYGFIAQEIEESLAGRDTNMITRQNDERGSYLFRSSDLLAPIVKSVQEQQVQIDGTRQMASAALDAALTRSITLPVWLEGVIAVAAFGVLIAALLAIYCLFMWRTRQNG